jgi:hypothetical protein
MKKKAKLAAAGLMDTEFSCFMKPEVGHAETTVHS